MLRIPRAAAYHPYYADPTFVYSLVLGAAYLALEEHGCNGVPGTIATAASHVYGYTDDEICVDLDDVFTGLAAIRSRDSFSMNDLFEAMQVSHYFYSLPPEVLKKGDIAFENPTEEEDSKLYLAVPLRIPRCKSKSKRNKKKTARWKKQRSDRANRKKQRRNKRNAR